MKKLIKKTKVLVAMSGGVDSSVAALMMKEKGYEVIGAFMKNWSDTKNDFGECSWKDDRHEAMRVASKLKIPLITLDFEKQYRKEVIDEMFRLYRQGVTPNPDIDCNQKIKFPLLWLAAKKLGADYIVTGHYAKIKKIVDKKYIRSTLFRSGIKNSVNSKLPNINGTKGWRGGNKRVPTNREHRYELLRAKDETKDQSYFLYRLKESDLKHTLFPIGDYTKKQIREIAKKNEFENFNRKSTVGICFVGKVNLKDFLKKKIKPKEGKILNPDGKQIGIHDGVYYYTIGQRIGPRFGIEIEKNLEKDKKLKRWYVARKNLKKNEIVAAPEDHELNYRKDIFIKNAHWINEIPNKNKIVRLHARIRQVGELLPSKLIYDKKKKKLKLVLNKVITGVSEGQAVVLYQKKKVLGGGVIKFN